MHVALCECAHTVSYDFDSLSWTMTRLLRSRCSNALVLKQRNASNAFAENKATQTHLHTIAFKSAVFDDIDFSQSSSKSPGKLDVFLHNRDSFRV